MSLGQMRSDVVDSRWKRVFSDIAHTLIVWSFSLNSDPNLILSYDVGVFRAMFEACREATPR
jgi:hypothetical protein